MIKKLDKLARDKIRKRDKEICQWCGKPAKGSNGHCSHVIPKSKGYALRWDLRNLKWLCFHCHINVWHKNPAEAWSWFQREFPMRADYLMEHKNDMVRSGERDEFLQKKLEELTY